MEDSRKYRNAEDWANHLLAEGKYAFALQQFRADFPEQSDTANKFALKRLVDKEQIISIHKGYYLIIPPQYRSKLDKIFDNQPLANALYKALQHNNAPLFRIPLKASAPAKGFASDERWKVIVNTEIEIDH